MLTLTERMTLAAILERLSSDHPREVLAAASLATNTLRKHGGTWAELLTAVANGAAEGEIREKLKKVLQKLDRQHPDHREAVRLRTVFLENNVTQADKLSVDNLYATHCLSRRSSASVRAGQVVVNLSDLV